MAAVGRADALGHPLTLAQALCNAALVHIFRHEPPAVADYAGPALRLSEEWRTRNGRRLPFVKTDGLSAYPAKARRGWP
jgi:hypothetical protein